MKVKFFSEADKIGNLNPVWVHFQVKEKGSTLDFDIVGPHSSPAATNWAFG